MRRHSILVVLVMLLAAGSSRAQTIEATVEGGKEDLKNVPVCVPVSVHQDWASYLYSRVTVGGMELEGQFTTPGLLTEAIPPRKSDHVRRDLHVILPLVKKGEKVHLSARLLKENDAPDTTGFFWMNTKDGDPELIFDVLSGARRRPVMRYMRAPYDNSTPQKRDRTYKVFHHLYDPAGKRFVTNGGHTDPYQDEKKLLYPHHRGLMYAFNKVSDGEGLKQTCDTWHAKPGDTYEQHEKVLSQEAGPVVGRHRVLISWRGPKNDVFATEERELTAYAVPGGTLDEFATKLMTADGKVRLDGDPQHAGCQFGGT
jgi:hypothetical protein